MDNVFKKAAISEGINVDGENLTNLRFADDFDLHNEKTLKQSELRKSESWPKNIQGNDKIHDRPCRQWRYTNWSWKKLKKGQNSNTSDKPHTPKTLQKKKSMPGSEQPGDVLEKKEILQDRQLPISLKNK